jgi:hypothetical protein
VDARKSRQLADRRKACVAGFIAMLSAGSIVLWPRLLIAQTSEQSDNPIRVGDRWTYATKDEVTGLPAETYTHVVTEISANQIVIGASTQGNGGSRPIIFDHDWNRLEGRNLKFSPHNGMGIRPVLAMGMGWRTEYEIRNTQSGVAFKNATSSKVVAQEAITTPAGTFDTFKIETRTHEISAADSSKFWDYEYVRWYAPQINHWIRWNSVTKAQSRLLSKRSEELIEFGRKE